MTHTFLAVAGKLVSVGLILLTPVIAVLLAALLWAVGLARGGPAHPPGEQGARLAGHPRCGAGSARRRARDALAGAPVAGRAARSARLKPSGGAGSGVLRVAVQAVLSRCTISTGVRAARLSVMIAS